ncbi:hypothetical protein NEIG_00944 [Nematocida sp. ERTm5]|nr:hypothetical protein NEIRO02_0325 [Nematocida sp. AWRm79]KAI5182667.1 hypothetical protein NEIRO03_0318 [Nematocida sp. AWRm78]OAG33389.1 hypothetical protein NEIG_00944 [Nematocida sp. ERTm5]
MLHLYKEIAGFLIEWILHLFGFFVALWIVYAIREALLDHAAPKYRPSEVATFLPPTCYIRSLKKQRYDL